MLGNISILIRNVIACFKSNYLIEIENMKCIIYKKSNLDLKNQSCIFHIKMAKIDMKHTKGTNNFISIHI